MARFQRIEQHHSYIDPSYSKAIASSLVVRSRINLVNDFMILLTEVAQMLNLVLFEVGNAK